MCAFKEVYTVVIGTFPVRVVAVGRWRHRWFNGDYHSRKKCLSFDPHGGSPLHITARSCIRAADQDGKEMLLALEWLVVTGGEETQRSRSNNWWTHHVIQPILLQQERVNDSLIHFMGKSCCHTLSLIGYHFCFAMFKGIVWMSECCVCCLNETVLSGKSASAVSANAQNWQIFTFKRENPL